MPTDGIEINRGRLVHSGTIKVECSLNSELGHKSVVLPDRAKTRTTSRYLD